MRLKMIRHANGPVLRLVALILVTGAITLSAQSNRRVEATADLPVEEYFTDEWLPTRNPQPGTVRENRPDSRNDRVPQKLYGTWVAEDVPTDIGQARIRLTFREDGPVKVLAWSEVPFVGQVRNIQAPFRVEGNRIISDAIRSGTTVRYRFSGEYLIIRYEDGKTVRFQRAE